jgi:hypothetical protein
VPNRRKRALGTSLPKPDCKRDPTGELIAGNASQPPLTLASLSPDWTRFHFDGRPPAESTCAAITNANLIWHGTLLLPASNPAGNVG